MERRAWPWKKKITEKLASAALEFKQGNEQLDSRIDLKGQADGMTPLQQAEAKLRILTEQLAAKDEVVLQHARVAEEAVSGWEKAESETASMREQLEAEIQMRLATEDRIAHLDGALKECMRQLRHVREQQEQKIHEAILKKTREWDGVQEEMEAKMAKLGSELLEAEAEKMAMTKSLQERAKAIMEAKEGRSIAEEQAKLLQVKLEMSEKEQAKWKYELHLLSKELQIRNEEIEYNKKASEVANKQHLENVKKVAKLESECQRLRLLVRKKLPGPAAISQMRMEVEALGAVSSVPLERGPHMSPSRRSRRLDRGETPWTIGVEADEEQLMAMAEENKALREALTKSKSELHAARMLCAHTVEQLENASSVSSYHGRPKLSATDGFTCSMGAGSSHEPSVASVSEDGAPEVESSCAESWATALMTELSQFKKGKEMSVSSSLLDPAKCEWMDDFAEMEKLASMPAESHAIASSVGIAGKDYEDVEDKRNANMENHAGSSDKSKACEDELNTVKLQSLAARAALLSIEKRLVSILQTGDASSLPDALDEIKALLHEKGLESKNHLLDTTNRPCLDMESAEVRDSRAWSPSDLSSCQSEESTSKQELASTGTVKVNTAGKELIIAMHKVAGLVDSISQVDCDMLSSGTHIEVDVNEPSGQADVMKQPRCSELNSCVQSLVTLCNGVLQGKVDIMDFLVEITSALDWLMSHIFSSVGMLREMGAMHRRLDRDKSSNGPYGSQQLDSVTGLNSWSSKSLCFKGEVSLLEQLSQLKAEKDEGHNKLKQLAMEVDALKSQLEETILGASDLQLSLDMALRSKEALSANVAALDSTKALLESELREARDDVKRLEERVGSLEVQLQDETQCRKDIEAMYQDIVGRRSCSSKDNRQTMVINDESVLLDESAAKTKQDQEIAAAAEKLAECQQTILALGKQLKDLGLPNAADEVPALRLSTYRSPKADHRVHSLSDQLPGAYGRGTDSTGASPIGFHQPIGEEEATSEGLHPDSLHGSQRGYYNGSAAGGHHVTSHVGTSYGPLLSPDTPPVNGILSPDHHDTSSSRRTTSKDLALTSPGRSPGRFLSLKRRVPEAKADGSSSEKHAMGFTRFFSRNKASR